MDEKDAIRKIRNSLRAGKSDSEIVRILHSKGYKLEYIHLLLKRAKRRKVLLFFFSGFLFLFLSFLIFIGVIVYSVLFVTSGDKMDLVNPLLGVDVNFGEKDVLLDVDSNEGDSLGVYVDDIEITPEFISYLLNELGAWKLRRHPLTGELPSLDFAIDDTVFNSIIDGDIVTSKGAGLDPDIVFYSHKDDIVRAMLSDSPDEVFKKSYNDGKSSVEVMKSETDLFLKGYLGLYDSLKS